MTLLASLAEEEEEEDKEEEVDVEAEFRADDPFFLLSLIATAEFFFLA